MSIDQTNAVREKVCAAMADMGGVCERLREFDQNSMMGFQAAEMKEEMQEWLDQAAETLQSAALIISGEVVPL